MKHSIVRFVVILLASVLPMTFALHAQDESESIFTVHVVQRGETLFRIALQHDLFAEQVATANGITDSNSIIVGQRLIIPLATVASDQRLAHTVSAGETLASIAAAYSRTEADLLALNSLESAESIFVGQKLVIVPGETQPETAPTTIPSAGADSSDEIEPLAASAPGNESRLSFARYGDPIAPFLYKVRSGDTLFEIALRYNQTVDALARENNLLDPGLLRVGQQLIIPGIQLPRLAQDLPATVEAFTIDPQVLETGRSVRIELRTSEAASISGQFLGRELRVIERDDARRHNIIVGVPMFTETAIYPLTLQLQPAEGDAVAIAANLQVVGGGYGYQTITINNNDLLAPAIEEAEIERLTQLMSGFTTDRYWLNSLSLPAAAAMNAVFGTLRSYNGGEYNRYHRGVDFAGAPGTSVLAAADGTVVIADRLQIRGNTTIIDHGWGVFTLYAHQRETLVQPGQVVASGQVIGTVGSTGRSTGPHLHWELWLNGVTVDPLQWVQEVFP